MAADTPVLSTELVVKLLRGHLNEPAPFEDMGHYSAPVVANAIRTVLSALAASESRVRELEAEVERLAGVVEVARDCVGLDPDAAMNRIAAAL